MDAYDALEVAKLAASVGSQLKAIDQFSVDRSSNPANKININSFIARVKNPNASIAPARYLTDTPPGWAAPPPEEFIQQQVPDVFPQRAPEPQPQPQLIPIPHVERPTHQPESIVEEKKNVKQKLQNEFSLTRSDVDSIKNSLKNIDKTLSGMLVLLQNKKLTTNE